MSYFFLNYSRSDVQNPYVKLFFESLIEELRSKLGLGGNVGADEIGFRDLSDLKVGENWSAELANELQSSRALVSLYSPGFFNSEYCGREFEVFRSRLLAYNKDNPPPLIFPVLWEMDSSVLKSIKKKVPGIQYTAGIFDEEYENAKYEKEGLRYLILRNDHKRFLHFFAKMMKEELEKHMDANQQHKVPPLATLPDLEKVESAWSSKAVPLPQSPPASESEGPSVAKFFFVAGPATDYNGIRKQVVCYNNHGGRFWSPFLPDVKKQVQLISGSAAEQAKATYFDFPVDDTLLKKIQDAEEKNTIVVLVVDPWSVEVQTYRDLLKACDNTALTNCGVIIAWNIRDHETSERQSALRERIRETFKKTFKLKHIYFRDSASSPEELEKELCTAIIEIRGKLMQDTQLVHEAESATPGTATQALPVVHGPRGAAV